MMPSQSHEDERSLIGCALNSATLARTLLSEVQPFMFEDARLQRTWSALRRVLEGTTTPGDLIGAVANELGGEPSLVDLHEIHAAVLAPVNASYYANQVRKAYGDRELKLLASEEVRERSADLSPVDLAAALAERAQHLREILEPGSGGPEAVSAWEVSGTDRP